MHAKSGPVAAVLSLAWVGVAVGAKGGELAQAWKRIAQQRTHQAGALLGPKELAVRTALPQGLPTALADDSQLLLGR